MTALVTNLGLGEIVANLIAGDTLKYLGWGGGSGQGITATDLASAFAESRVPGAAVAATTDTTDDTYRITGGITAAAARTVTEVGVFSSASGSEMDVYGDFSGINVAAGDAIIFSISIALSQV